MSPRQTPIGRHLSDRDRRELAGLWRQLAGLALTARDPAALWDLAHRATHWSSPTSDTSDAWSLFALPRLCLAFATRKASDDQRAAVAPLLKMAALHALQLLDAFEEPEVPIEPRAAPPPRAYKDN